MKAIRTELVRCITCGQKTTHVVFHDGVVVCALCKTYRDGGRIIRAGRMRFDALRKALQ